MAAAMDEDVPWHCGACTFKNTLAYAKLCEMCQFPRSSSSGSSSSSASGPWTGAPAAASQAARQELVNQLGLGAMDWSSGRGIASSSALPPGWAPAAPSGSSSSSASGPSAPRDMSIPTRKKRKAPADDGGEAAAAVARAQALSQLYKEGDAVEQSRGTKAGRHGFVTKPPAMDGTLQVMWNGLRRQQKTHVSDIARVTVGNGDGMTIDQSLDGMSLSAAAPPPPPPPPQYPAPIGGVPMTTMTTTTTTTTGPPQPRASASSTTGGGLSGVAVASRAALSKAAAAYDSSDDEPDGLPRMEEASDSDTDDEPPRQHSAPRCMHYKRGCLIVPECCGRLYECRLCHDAFEDHKIDRHKTKGGSSSVVAGATKRAGGAFGAKATGVPRPSCNACPLLVSSPSPIPPPTYLPLPPSEIVCKDCDHRQPVSNSCTKCGVAFGEYFCSVCRFWDKKRTADGETGVFHCDKCGICRWVGYE